MRPAENSRNYKLGYLRNITSLWWLWTYCCQPGVYKNQESESHPYQLLASKLGSGLRLTPPSRGKKEIIFTVVWFLLVTAGKLFTRQWQPTNTQILLPFLVIMFAMMFLWKANGCLGLCRMQHSLSLWTNRQHCSHEKRHTRLSWKGRVMNSSDVLISEMCLSS